MTVALIGMVCLWSVLPGPATLMILSDGWTHGKRAGLMTAVGGCVGVLVYVGIALMQCALFADMSTWASQDTWVLFLRIVGAAALAVLGLTSLHEGILKITPSTALPAVATAQTAKPHGFASGFYLSFLSPQSALFYLVVLPQVELTMLGTVLGTMWSILLIGLFHVVFRTIWYGGLIHITTTMQPYATGQFMQISLKMIAGILFLALSVRIIA